jgi:hypothetical protein
MTRESFRSDYDASRSYLVGGELLNRLGRAMMGEQGGERSSGVDMRRGAVTCRSSASETKPTDVIMLRNGCESARSKYQVLQLGVLADEKLTDGIPTLWGWPFASRSKRIAALLDNVDAGGLVPAQVAGACLCWVDVENVAHPRAYPKDVDDVALTSGFAGPATLLSTPTETGMQVCLVRLSEPNAVQLLVLPPEGGIPAATHEVGPPESITPGEADCEVWVWDSAQGKEVPLMIDGPATGTGTGTGAPVAVTVTVKNFASATIARTEGKPLNAVSDDDYEFVAIVGGSTAAVTIRFRIISVGPFIGEYSAYCITVLAEVLDVSCGGSGVEIGDEVVIWDPSQCNFNIPADLLPGMYGTAIQMSWGTVDGTGSGSGSGTGTGSGPTIGVPGISECVDGLGSGTGWVEGQCWWMVQTLSCGEDLYYA